MDTPEDTVISLLLTPHPFQTSAATSRIQQTVGAAGGPAIPGAATAREPQSGGAGRCAEGSRSGPER